MIQYVLMLSTSIKKDYPWDTKVLHTFYIITGVKNIRLIEIEKETDIRRVPLRKYKVRKEDDTE